jgi:hypothetical protein
MEIALEQDTHQQQCTLFRHILGDEAEEIHVATTGEKDS